MRPARRPATVAATSVVAGLACALSLATLAPSASAVSRPASAGTVLATADTTTLTAAERRIASKLTARATTTTFGTGFSGRVMDVADNRLVWSRRGTTELRPASTTKLVTATNALSVYGPAHRFTTTVRRGSSWGSIVLVGAGDPSLSSAHLTTLAQSTAEQVKAQGVSTVKVWADDYLFPWPTLATGWKTTYVPTEVRAVRALVVDERHSADTSITAAKVFAAKLAEAGVQVSSVGRSQAPAGSMLLASVQGQRLDSIVTRMLLVSDNDHAEALHRLVALRAGYPTTWSGARTAQRLVMNRERRSVDVDLLYDGSGLSRSDRLTTRELVLTVDHLFDANQPELAVMRGAALPISGRTGTLKAAYGRYNTWPSSCAVGKIHAKTGTLSDTVALAGWTTGTDGRKKAFAFLVNGKDASLSLKRKIDGLAATVTGCW